MTAKFAPKTATKPRSAGLIIIELNKYVYAGQQTKEIVCLQPVIQTKQQQHRDLCGDCQKARRYRRKPKPTQVSLPAFPINHSGWTRDGAWPYLPVALNNSSRTELNSSQFILSVNGKKMLVRRQKNHSFANKKRVDKRWNGTSDATTGGRPARLAVSRRRQKNRLEDPARPAAVEEKCSTNATMAQYYELAASDVHVNNYVILQKAAAGFCDKSTVLLILVLTHHGNKLLRIAVHTTDLGHTIPVSFGIPLSWKRNPITWLTLPIVSFLVMRGLMFS